jgi:hypothetical protein
MYGGLASTSTGSLLLSEACLTSSYPVHPPILDTLPELPKPDWSVLEGQPSLSYESRDSLKRKIESLTTQLEHSHCGSSSEGSEAVWSCLVLSIGRQPVSSCLQSIPPFVASLLHDGAIPHSPRRCVMW